LGGTSAIFSSNVTGNDFIFGANLFASRRYATIINGISSAGYTNICNVTGNSLASSVKVSFQGTADSTVVNTLATIIVNHFQDIYIKSESGIYTILTLRVISDNNENYTIQATTDSAFTVNLNVEVFPQNSETVVFSATPLSGTTLTHVCSPGMAISSTGGENGNFRAGGNGVFVGNLTAASFIRNGGTSAQFLKADGSVDSNAYITGNQTITLSGDATGSGTTAITVVLANSGVAAGTYNDSATQVRPFTVDAKGRVTSIETAVTITPAFSNITGKPTTLSGYGITDAYTQTQVNTLLSGYLPLTGGTLTGGLLGTTASFSGIITTTSTSAASGNLGGVSSSWLGSSTYPTLFSSAADRWVMHINPHISYTENGVNGFTGTMLGATLRFASNPAADTFWDIGVGTNSVGADTFSIGRAGTNLFRIATTGVATLPNLGGSGSRMVVASSTGVLSTQAITVGTVTSVAALTIGTSGTDLSSSVANGTTTPVITLNVPTASAANRGALSAADWSTFNNKQNALTNPVTGTGTAGQVAYWSSSSAITGESNLFWDATNDRLGIGTASPVHKLDINGTARVGTSGYTDTLFRSLYVGRRSFDANFSIINLNPSSGNNNFGFDIGVYDDGTAGNQYLFIGDNRNSERIRLSSSGNLGLGVTPSAWGSQAKAMQLGTGAAISGIGSDTHVSNGIFYDGSNWKYLYSGLGVSTYYQVGGNHIWFSAPSGAAAGNNVSLTQAMTLGSNSGLSIGTPSAAPAQGLLVQGASTFNGIVRIAGVGNSLRFDTTGSDSSNGIGTINSFETLIFNGRGSAGFAVIGNSNIRLGFGSNWDASQTSLLIQSTGAATFSSSVSSTEFRLNNVSTLQHINVYTVLKDLVGRNAILLGDTNDPSNYYDNTNHIFRSRTGVPRLVINQDGNVGIGTASPSAMLTLLGLTPFIRIERSGVNTWQIQNNNNVGTITGFSINNVSAGTTPFFINQDTGNLLLGATADNGFRLDVNGTGRFSGRLLINSSTNYSALQNTNTSGNIYWGIDNSTGSDFTGVSYARFIYSEGAYPLITYVNGAERMRIASTGAASFSSSVTAGGAITTTASATSGSFGSIASSWSGSTTFPTLFSSSNDRWVMHINPHISYTQNGVNGFTGSMTGSTIRFASNPAAASYWDAGVGTNSVGADTFSIGRAGTDLFRIAVGGAASFSSSVTANGQIIQGGGTARSTFGTTVAFTRNVAFSANSDIFDDNRFLSVVNQSTLTNAYSTLSFRVNPDGGGNNAMLDMKFVNLSNGSNLSNQIWSFLHNGSFIDRMNLSSNGRLTVNGNILTGVLKTTDDTELATDLGNVKIGTTSNAAADKLRVNGNTFTNTIMTWNPENDNRSGVAWRLGAATIGAVTPNRRLRVNVGGVEYFIGAVEV
jgi:hypothetical protein